MKIAALAALLLAASSGIAGAAPENRVVVDLPQGAVSIDSCRWKATRTSFDTDIRLKDHTNLKIAKARLLLNYVDTYGESVQSYVDMVGTTIAPASGLAPTGKWQRGVFPTDLRTLQCTLVGVKFEGYPNVIYSTMK